MTLDIGRKIHILKSLSHKCPSNWSLRCFNGVTFDTVMRERDAYYGFEGDYTDYYDDVLKFNGSIIWDGNWTIDGPWVKDIEVILDTIQKQMEDFIAEEKAKNETLNIARILKEEKDKRKAARELAKQYKVIKR